MMRGRRRRTARRHTPRSDYCQSQDSCKDPNLANGEAANARPRAYAMTKAHSGGNERQGCGALLRKWHEGESRVLCCLVHFLTCKKPVL